MPAEECATLITGAGGEIGSALVDYYRSKTPSKPLITLDIRALPEKMKTKVTKEYTGSVTDEKLWAEIESEFIVDEVVHLAAYLSVSAEKKPEEGCSVNIIGMTNALAYGHKWSKKMGKSCKVFFSSSIAAYGVGSMENKMANPCLKEDQFLNPITMYGHNKLSCEQLGYYYANHYRMLDESDDPKVDFRCIRFPGIISACTIPDGGSSDYGPEMLHMAAQDRAYETFVLPTTVMPFVTMDDVVVAITQILEAPKEKLTQLVYNIAAFHPTAAEIEAKVKEYFPAAQISYKPHAPRMGIVDSWPCDMDSDAARADWGFDPKHDMDRAFEEYLVPVVRRLYA